MSFLSGLSHVRQAYPCVVGETCASDVFWGVQDGEEPKGEVVMKTFVTLVLDETGSMQSIKDDTIGGFNTYVDTLKASPDEILFTLIKFDSNHTTKVHVAEPIAGVVHLNDKTYVPGASTPLIDACVKAIRATEEKVASIDPKPNVLIVIQTDGHENASVEFKRDDLVALVKEKTAAGWQFVFLGAGIDAFDAAMSYGITAQNTLSYSRDTSAATFAAAAMNTAEYARTGASASLSWTRDQRAATGDHQPPPDPNATAKVPPAAPVPPTKKAIVEDIKL